MPLPAIDFIAIVQLLSVAEVRYVVIGGVAMHLHGANNLTVDRNVSVVFRQVAILRVF